MVASSNPTPTSAASASTRSTTISGRPRSHHVGYLHRRRHERIPDHRNVRICRESGARRMSHNVAVANSEAPAPSEMDTALLDAVSTALNEHPAGVATLTHTWNDDAGMWFVKVSPRLASAADFSIAYDGEDLLTVTVGNIWFEIFPIKSVEELGYAREIAVAVFAGKVEESGPLDKASGRIHLKEGPVGVGSVHLPWPWRPLPVKRHYNAYE